jgi:DNA-binding NarL/FixJ family response regulator
MVDETQPLEILLVATTPELRSSYRDLLNMYTSGDRYAFFEADSARAGIEQFDPKSHACVLVSDDLADQSIDAFLAELRTRSDVVPAVVIGTRSDAASRERALAAGALAYLSQAELGAKTLSHAVLDALARADAERARRAADAPPEASPPGHESTPEADVRAPEPPTPRTIARGRGVVAGFARATLAIPVECVFDHQRLHGSVDELSRTGARVQGLTARPAVGASVTLRLRLLDGAPPLEIPSRVTEHVAGNGFVVAFDNLDRRKRELLRVVTSRGRKGPPV